MKINVQGEKRVYRAEGTRAVFYSVPNILFAVGHDGKIEECRTRVGTLGSIEECDAGDLVIGEDEIADEDEASFANTTSGDMVARHVHDPETVNIDLLLADDSLQKMWVDTTTTPGGERQEVPEIAVAWGQGKREMNLIDATSLVSQPAIGYRDLL